MFASFRSRITRAYVLLALLLVLVVALASSAMALLLFSRGAADSLAGETQRLSEASSAALAAGATLEQAAPAILRAGRRSRLHIMILDDRGRPLAQSGREEPPSPGRTAAMAIGSLIGLPSARIPVPGGTIVLESDFDRFGQLLIWYWGILIPIALAAMLAAWLAGRRITAQAIGPLAQVTQALRVIAAGDFSPQRLLGQSGDLRELTSAYNDVAHSLASATAQSEKTQTQMRQFIADAGHELRTPLTVVMGYLDALKQGIVRGEDGTQRTYDIMLDESRKMRALIEKLILLARLDRAPSAARLGPVDLNNLAARVAQTLEPLAHGRITVIPCDAEVTVSADEAELHEAVKNIVDNALKYASASPVRVAVRRDGGNACIMVSDEGPGMDAQDLEHAFDRFYRGSSHGEIEGSGLGLAIARRAAERAGGTAAITSANPGTLVELCLPLAVPA